MMAEECAEFYRRTQWRGLPSLRTITSIPHILSPFLHASLWRRLPSPRTMTSNPAYTLTLPNGSRRDHIIFSPGWSDAKRSATRGNATHDFGPEGAAQYHLPRQIFREQHSCVDPLGFALFNFPSLNALPWARPIVASSLSTTEPVSPYPPSPIGTTDFTAPQNFAKTFCASPLRVHLKIV